ncbi:MAG: filamentous hemagglutinin N-terminal domain-containing protein [Phycisphaeraceae bacterium]|nr:MAG: filamentous hemagglutinin N-terminal domain-containing protein [Phycisphaeraceae bacterium]
MRHVNTGFTNFTLGTHVGGIARSALSRLTRLAGSASGRSVKGRAAAASALAAVLAASALAGPEGYQVVVGNVTFTRQGDMWVITASNGAIINYTSFNILPFETVQFLQPSQLSTVLNRINSAAPTRIDGTLLSNGQVFFVNPAGVIFGQGATVNVGGIYAAAGNISDADFVNGRLNFTNNTGSVINQGQIRTETTAALIGRHVANYGTIVSPQGAVVMAAGDDVYVGREGSRIYARIENTTTPTDQTRVENHGTIDAGRGQVLMAAGDTYGLAIFNTGTVKGRDIELAGGDRGEVRVSGTIDASDRSSGGTGGTVRIVGEKVGLFGATVDASGDAGGGTVHLGGGLQGAGDRTADYVFIDEHSTVSADAVTYGRGGEIIVYAERAARIYGSLYARGGVAGGAGGFIETSGGYLYVSDIPDMRARDGLSAGGTWLIDPFNIRVVAGSGTGDFGDPNNPYDNPTVNDSQLGVDAILAALALGDVIISTGGGGAQAGDITWEVSMDYSSILASRTLTLSAHNDITFLSGVSISGGPGSSLSISLNADSDNNGSGGVFLNDASFSLRGGNFVVSANTEGLSFLSGGLIDTGGGNMNLFNTGATSLGGSITLGGGALTATGASSITIAGTVQTDGGNVSLNTAGNILIDAAVDADTGLVTMTSTGGDVTINASVTGTAGITASAANDLTVGADLDAGSGDLNLFAGTDGTGNLTVGTSSAVALTGNNVTLSAGTGAGGDITFAQATTFNAAGPISMNAGTGTININAALGLGSSDTTLRADEIEIAAAVSGSGALTIRTGTLANSIQLGGAGGTGALDLTAAELALLNAGFSSITIGDSGMTGVIDIAGNIAFNDNVTFLTDNAGRVDLGGDVTGDGSVTFDSAVRMTADATVTGAGVTFEKTIDADLAANNRKLTVNTTGGSATIFGGTIGGTEALGSLETDADGTTELRGDITVVNTIEFGDNVTLAADVTMTSTANDRITFGGTLDSDGTARSLTIASTGLTVFEGAVGGGSALNNLSVGGAAEINGGLVRTEGTQTYSGTVDIGADTTLVASEIEFNDTVSGPGFSLTFLNFDPTQGIELGGAGGTGALDLTAAEIAFLANGFSSINFGDTSHNGPISIAGNIAFLDAVTFTVDGGGGGVITLGGNVDVTDGTGDASIKFNGAVIVTADSVVSSAGSGANGDINFNGTVDGDAPGRSLTINTQGNTGFTGAVGSTTALGDLITDAGGTTTLGGSVTTSNSQVYNDDIILSSDVTLANTGGAGISILGQVNGTTAGAQSLTITDDGAATTFGPGTGFGETTILNNLTMNGSAGASIDFDITTQGDQSYSNAITVSGDRTFQGQNVSFTGGLDGSAATDTVQIVASDSVTLGAVGQSQAFDVLRVQSGTAAGNEIVLQGNVTTNLFQDWNGAVRLDAPALTLTSGQMLFRRTINGTTALTENLTLIATTPAGPGVIPIMFGGSIGATTSLGALTIGTALGAAPEYASIVFAEAFGDVDGNPNTFDFLPTAASVDAGDLFAIVCDTLNVEANQKLTALGSLAINATTSATLGDLSTLGNLSVTTPTLNIRMRDGATVRDAAGNIIGDIGTDWAAGGTLVTNAGTINLLPGLGTFSFSYGQGGADAGLTGIGAPSRQVVILETIFSNPANTAFLLNLDLTSQTTTDQPPIAGINPRIEVRQVATPEPVSGELSEFLKAIGVNISGEPDFGQVIDWLIGRSLYDDTSDPDPTLGPQRFRVSRERLALDVVMPIKETFDDIFRTPRLDPDGAMTFDDRGNPVLDDNSPAVRAVIGRVWDRYADQDPDPTGAGFRAFVEASAGADRDATEVLRVLEGLRSIFGLLDKMGLSEFETRGPKNTLVGPRYALPGDNDAAYPITPEQLRDAVMGTTPSDLPAAMLTAR